MLKATPITLVLFVTTLMGALPVHAAASQPTLKTAKIIFLTPEGDDKDTDTKVSVGLYTEKDNEYKRLLAKRESFAGDTTFEDPAGGSTHAYELTLQGTIVKDDVDGMRVCLDVEPEGNDTWKFNYKVQLYFSDGTTLEKGADGVTLKQDDKHYERTF